jgi:hypothetical protein
MKTVITFTLFIVSFILYGQENEYFLESIRNGDGTVDFTVATYPISITPNKREDGSYFTIMKMAVVNNPKANDLIWNDYKIYILTKDGQLFFNYTPSMNEGEYACNYTVTKGSTHQQWLCFDTIFNLNDIEKIWISFGDNQFISLIHFVDDRSKTVKEQIETLKKK